MIENNRIVYKINHLPVMVDNYDCLDRLIKLGKLYKALAVGIDNDEQSSARDLKQSVAGLDKSLLITGDPQLLDRLLYKCILRVYHDPCTFAKRNYGFIKSG